MGKGTLFIISAPSGAGKTSLVNEILGRMNNIQASISHTTRDCRPGEQSGVDYHFVNHDDFLSMISNNAFLEHAEVFGKSIFILPPSKKALRQRLNGRGQDDEDVIAKRIAAATEEMSHYVDANYLVVNDDFSNASNELEAIITATRCQQPVSGVEKLLLDLLS